MNSCWNDAEDEALQGLPLRAQVIYLRGILRHVDADTGIVGMLGTLTLKQLADIVSTVENKQADLPTKKAIRISLDQLKKAGLIERRGDDDELVFFLPLATLRKANNTNQGTTRAQQPRHNKGTPEAANGAASNDTTTLTTAQLGHTHKGTLKTAFGPPNMPEISNQTAIDLIAHRKAKGAPMSETVWERAKKEFQKAGLSPQLGVEEWLAKGWQGFNAAWWMKDEGLPQAQNQRGAYRTTTEQRSEKAITRMAEWAQEIVIDETH